MRVTSLVESRSVEENLSVMQHHSLGFLKLECQFSGDVHGIVYLSYKDMHDLNISLDLLPQGSQHQLAQEKIWPMRGLLPQ